MRVHIITDSTADLRPEIREKVQILPLTIHFGAEEYIDGITMDSRSFYEKLVESDVLPTTSQATPAAFQEAYAQALASGGEVLAITLASQLSGTYQSAMIAASDYPGRVTVVDSGTAAIGGGILVELAVKLAEQGLSAGQIAAQLEQEKKKIRIVALVDTLEYLKKGGRLSAAVALAGTLLSIKPVMLVQDGEIRLLGKARGSRQGNNLLVQEIHKAGGVDFEKPLMLGYTGLSDALLQKYIADSAALWQGHEEALHTAVIGSVVGTHVGPGTIAAAFFAREA